MAQQQTPPPAFRVKKVISIGPARETLKIKEAIESISRKSIKVETVLTVVPGQGEKLTREQLLPQLMPHLQGADATTMVITDIGDTRPYKFEMIAQDVKAYSNGAAFVILTSKPECVGDPAEFAAFIASSPRGFDPAEIIPKVDYVIHYTGRTEVLATLVDMHEDRLNYKNDLGRAILVVEDKPNYYTGFLSSLYGLNNRRAHLLLARNYEEATEIIHNVKQRFAGAIIGMRFPKQGKSSEEACWELLNLMRAYDRGVPAIFQSASNRRLAQAMAVAKEKEIFTLSKRDPILLMHLGNIIRDFFGFGDFIFRDLQGSEIARARTMEELYGLIGSIDGASLVAHASRDDFSNWLHLHGHGDAAKVIKPMFTQNAELLRSILLSDLAPFVHEK